MKKSLAARLARLEAQQPSERPQTGIIVYDSTKVPSDPLERGTFFMRLRPPGMNGCVVYLPANGR